MGSRQATAIGTETDVGYRTRMRTELERSPVVDKVYFLACSHRNTAGFCMGGNCLDPLAGEILNQGG